MICLLKNRLGAIITGQIESRLIAAISCSGNCIMHASPHHQTHFGRYNQANYSVFPLLLLRRVAAAAEGSAASAARAK